MSPRYSEQKSEGILKHFITAFVLAVLCYVLGYGCDRHLRLRKGPWEFTFSAEADGTPTLIINQPQVGVTNVTLRMPGSPIQMEPTKVLFEGPGQDIPFGKLVFFDTTYLPGTVTMELFGHEVECMSRTLVLNFKEHPWQAGETITLAPEDRWRDAAAESQDEQTP